MSGSDKLELSTVFNNEELIRIVLVGKTGAGKSSAGNTILRKQVFEADFCPESLTTCCAKAMAVVDGEKVAVIDTPGLFDTRRDEETASKDIRQCISYACPGPNVFLVVVQLGKFTDEEKKTIQIIQQIFGADADKYTLVLFTHGDKLKGKTIEKFLSQSSGLQELVNRCNGQYHVFNNEAEDPSQVTELLKKIRKINEKNGGSYYTNEMFQKVEEAIEEEKQRILKEKEEQMRQEVEKLRKEIEKEYEQRLREVKGDEEKERLLKIRKRNEMDEKVENLRTFLESQARQEAESSSFVMKILKVIFNTAISFVLPIIVKKLK